MIARDTQTADLAGSGAFFNSKIRRQGAAEIGSRPVKIICVFDLYPVAAPVVSATQPVDGVARALWCHRCRCSDT
jgi:hypothetical protein